MDVSTAAGQQAMNFFVATPSRILFERAACERPLIRTYISRQVLSIRGKSSAPSFLTPFTSILGVLSGGEEQNVMNGLLHVAHASLWSISVPFIQGSITEAAKGTTPHVALS
jgi:hypothetical protein